MSSKTVARDAEILRLMEVEQLRARTVARRLGISETTVSRAWRRAMDRRESSNPHPLDWHGDHFAAECATWEALRAENERLRATAEAQSISIKRLDVENLRLRQVQTAIKADLEMRCRELEAEIERLRVQVAAALDLLAEKPSEGESLADCDKAAWDAAALLRGALARHMRA